jgi:hypothetical protein
MFALVVLWLFTTPSFYQGAVLLKGRAALILSKLEFIKIVLFYPSKGILVSYWGEGRSVTHSGANYLTVCADELYKFGPMWLFALIRENR